MMNTMLGGTAAIRARGLQRAEPLSSARIQALVALKSPRNPADGSAADRRDPDGEGWQFEPKWDGFRCLAFRDGDAVELGRSRASRSGATFPRIVDALLALEESRFVLDGELVLPEGETLSFAALQMRLHPAASRIARLARETPAQLMLFDCLQLGAQLLQDRLPSARAALGGFMRSRVRAAPAALAEHRRRRVAEAWFARTAGRSTGSSPSGSTSPTSRASGPMARSSATDRGLCGRRLSDVRRSASARCCSGFTTTGPAQLGRLHVVVLRSPSAASCSRSSSRCRALGLHRRPRPGAEPVEQGAQQRMGPAEARARRRGDLRPGHRRALPPRHDVPALATRQGAAQCTMDQLGHELEPATLADVLERALNPAAGSARSRAPAGS
jgi:hypothetical protein